MERALNEAAREAMAEAVLNPEFQAALDAFEPAYEASIDPAVELDADQVIDLLDTGDGFDDPEFAAMAAEVEASAENVIAPEHRPVPDAPVTEMKISPFALLVNPGLAIAAAKHLDSLTLPRRVVFLFGKKGVTSNPEISRLDQDMDLEADEDLEEDSEEATVTEQ